MSMYLVLSMLCQVFAVAQERVIAPTVSPAAIEQEADIVLAEDEGELEELEELEEDVP